jgi:branched-chain amino acid transport system substrate-binding protein
MDCDCSGIVGAIFAPALATYSAWVSETNSQGGIDGHPVKLLYADDGGSSTQDLQNVEHFVLDEHAIALVNLFASSGGTSPVRTFAQNHNIPIVGGDGVEDDWFQSPVMFDPSASTQADEYAWAAEMKRLGLTNVGAIYCAESSNCAHLEQGWKAYASQVGLKVTYESEQSLATPNFSANCINARSNGVQAILVVMDGASATRLAGNCSQQGYNPPYVPAILLDHPPADMNGSIGALDVFPWFLTSGSPALSEYGAAVRRYVHTPLDNFSAKGWVNAKLLQAALTGHVSAVPTSKEIFDGLAALSGSTLGGLTGPLSFPAGKAHPPLVCTYKIVAENGQWTAPQGMSLGDCMP